MWFIRHPQGMCGYDLQNQNILTLIGFQGRGSFLKILYWYIFMLNIGELKVVEVKNFTQFPWLNAD